MAEPLPNWDTHDAESLRPFSRISLIVADLDGTLLQPKTTRLYETIKKLRASLSYHKYQVSLTIATGRALSGVRPLLEKLSLNRGMPIILYNGSIVVRNESFAIISQRTISSESLLGVLDAASKYSVRTLAYVYNEPALTNYRSSGDYGSHEHVLGWSTIEPIEYEFNKMRVQWQDRHTKAENVSPAAILVDTSRDSKAEAVLSIDLEHIQDISIISSQQHYIEIRPRGSNKGVALEYMVSFLGLSREEVLAFGDDDNDAEMLSRAGIGVAVSGASATALAHSNYICRHNVEAGAIEVLRLVRNARRYYFLATKGIAGAKE